MLKGNNNQRETKGLVFLICDIWKNDKSCFAETKSHLNDKIEKYVH